MDFVRVSSKSQIRVQHADNFLGYFWLVLGPVLLAVTFYFVIALYRRSPPDSGEFTRIFLALILIQFITTTLQASATAITGSGSFVLNQALDRTALPVSSLVVGIRRLMPAVTVGLLVAIVFSGFPAGTVLVMIPSFVITATALLGLGFVLAAWTVRIRDLSPLVVLSTRILTYSSPVLYAPEMLPERFWNLALVNPFFWPIAWWSTAWSGGNEAPNFFWVISGATAITLLLLGLTVFRRSQPQFGRYL